MSSPRPPKTKNTNIKQGIHQNFIPTTPTVFDNFKQGDILFGLNEAQNKVGPKLAAKGFHHLYANTLNSPTIDTLLNPMTDEERQKKIDSLDNEQKAHFQFLTQHKDYLAKVPGKSVPLMKDSSPWLGAAYRRGCKLLLTNRTHRNYTAHFITQGIFWKKVCSKNNDNASVTGSELRAAYRDALKHGPNPGIKFYDSRHREITTPPWEIKEYKTHWDQYQETRNKKRKHQDSPQPTPPSDLKELKLQK